MLRVALTIILNGKHHLVHNNYASTIADNFDYWIIVEGYALPNGSTNWCKRLPDDMHINGLSIDGTSGYLDCLAKENPSVIVVRNKDKIPWNSKDDMVNAGIGKMREIGCGNCFLWQIDIDEQWKIEDIEQAEEMLVFHDSEMGEFLCDYWCGSNIKAVGEWGEGKLLPYRRLWHWKGQWFKTHEPPELEGGNGTTILLPQRFNHYAYYFEKDIKFKEKYYGYDNLYTKWMWLQQCNEWPQPVSMLINGPWGERDTKLIRIEQ